MNAKEGTLSERERNILGESYVYNYGTPSEFHIEEENGWADSLLSLAFATRFNPKHPSYVSTRLFWDSISQFCCGEQTIMKCSKLLTIEVSNKYILKK